LRLIYILIVATIFFTSCANNSNISNVVYKVAKPQQPIISKVKVVKEIDNSSDKNVTTKDIEVQDNQLQDVKIKDDKIAIVFASQKIGKYAINATNTAIGYLLYNKNNFDLKIYDTLDENQQSIKNIFEKLEDNNITKAIVYFTPEAIKWLSSIKNIDKFTIYLPLVYKDDVTYHPENIIFGSIDYQEQINTLLDMVDNSSIVNLYDDSTLGIKLKKMVDKQTAVVYDKKIDNRNENYKYLIKKHKKLFDKSSIFLNMPIVKSSMMMSQMYANGIENAKILSTQLNYTPLLFSLTQYQDRRNMIIANSIPNIKDRKMIDFISLLESNIEYSWVNISTLIGLDYLLYDDLSKTFDNISILNNQIVYPIDIYTIDKYSFHKLN